MEVGKAVLQRNNFSDLNDVRYVMEAFCVYWVWLFYFSECYFRGGSNKYSWFIEEIWSAFTYCMDSQVEYVGIQFFFFSD